MRGIILAILVSMLMACAGHAPAPVSDRYQSTEQSPDYHVVMKGDTIFSIAFRYGKTVDQVASYNRISAPYTIYIGQKLVLKGPKSVANKAKSTTNKSIPAPTIKPAPTHIAKSTSPRPSPVKVSSDNNWSWPLETKGTISARFENASSSNKGIDIVAPVGTNVLAARGGVVVYAGSSLPGYGNLLIIKHDAVYLSAYAHNQKLLVKEGDKISPGQHIAELGSTATPSPKLHFEIRKDGAPIDPLGFMSQPK